MKDKNIILKTLVGSQAHGLADESSDYDYRGVFVEPTSKILSLGYKYKSNDWFEGKEDQTLYEIGHFLHLATKCNPSILEVFKGPLADNFYGKYINGLILHEELKNLFPYIWNPNDAYNAFTGYSSNQRTKLFKDKEYGRDRKYACAYLRTLYNLKSLLLTGDFTLDVTHNSNYYKRLKDIRAGKFTKGDVINEAEKLIEECKILRDKCNHEPNLTKINDFLLNIRKEFWDDK